MWYRVFGLRDAEVPPAALQAALGDLGHDVPLHVRGDDLGWTAIDLGPALPLSLERYLTAEDDLRDDLDTWAAWLETKDQPALMQHVISTRQLITLRSPGGSDAECEALARLLARETDGVYQIDGRGFFAADGTRLTAEE